MNPNADAVPTPLGIAAAIAGRGATLHKVGRGGKLAAATEHITCDGMMPDEEIGSLSVSESGLPGSK